MDNNISSSSSLKIKDVLDKAISLYKNNLPLFIGISAVGALPVLLIPIFSLKIGLILVSVDFFIRIWAYAALILAASRKYHNEAAKIAECFASIRGKYWRVVGVNTIYSLISLAGLLLFFIPSIYWGTVFCFANIVVITEKRKEIGPFKLSSKLIKGFFWETFWCLAIFLSPFLLPLITVLTLYKTSPKLSAFLMNVVYAIVFPFFIAGKVSLYHKLSEIKEEELGRSQDVIRKSRYGWLFAAGLIIVITILGGIWVSQIGRFIFSKEKAITKVSPPIVFPGGVTLSRPSGYLVLHETAPRLEYTLFHFKKNKDESIGLRLSLYAFKDLGLDGRTLNLSDQDIAKKIRYENFDKNEFIRKLWEKKHGIFETKSIKLTNLNNRSWGECIFVASSPASSAKKQGYVWKIYYTPVKDNMLVADFGYTFNIGETEEPEISKGELAEEEKMAIDIIKSIQFPE